MTSSQSRPRILILTTIPETMAAFLVPQLRHLDAGGFDVHVASSPGAALDTLEVPSSVQRHRIAIERRPSPVHDLASLWNMIRLIRLIRPQIVHAHTPKAGLIGMAAARLARVPVRLYTVHGLPLLTRGGMWRQVLEVAERASASMATHTYSVSESVRDLMDELRLTGSRRVTVLGSGSCAGVDTERFRPCGAGRDAARAMYGIRQDATLVTFVGRLARDKGIAVLAEAWPTVAAEFPGAHLLLAGERDNSDPACDLRMEELRCHPRVTFAGPVAKDAMPGIYAATDIGVLPTFREGLPQTALEAGAAGIPMVSTRVSGVVNAVVDGVTGLLVPAHQATPLAIAIGLLLKNPDLRRRMGGAARAHVVSSFSEDRVSQLWMSEYCRLVDTLLPNCTVPLREARVHSGRHDAF